MEKSLYITTDGKVKEVEPKDGKYFSLEELKMYIGGGTVQIVPMPSGRYMVIDDNGKITGLGENRKATEVWKQEYPVSEYPLNNDELIVGDALIASKDSIE